MINIPPQYWFRAKRYGWGWGLPTAWQGWTVLIVWFVVVCTGGHWIALKSMWLFYLFVAIMAIVLTTIAFITGEPTCWRWGKE